MKWLAALLSGMAAGIIATAVQLALWWAASLPVMHMLLRDSRLAAAIVMGSSALPPPASFDWDVMIVATLIHFTLSAVYGCALALFISRMSLHRSVLAGAIFGLALFGLNMYGFTLVFPWFDASRDWITGMAHVAFGMSAAVLYKRWQGSIL
ncbi:hypothetical protein GCM10027343_28850 [Noviherbaspirillum agri]